MLSCLLILYFMGVVRCLSMTWCAVMCANIIFYGCSEVSMSWCAVMSAYIIFYGCSEVSL